MQRFDHRGLALSCGSQESIDGYEQALIALHSYSGDPLKLIDDTLANDPDFFTGHAFRAALFVTAGDRRGVAELERSVKAAEALMARGYGNERERAHIAAAQAWLEGRFNDAAARYNRLVIDSPRDALAVQTGHIVNFFLGRSSWLRDHVASALPHYSPAEPSYGYLLGMLSFGLEENNEFSRAEVAGQRALDHNRRDPWAIHALAHCAEMQGRAREGIDLYESRRSDWAEDSFFCIHNWWHLALFYLDQGDTSRVLELYDQNIRGGRSEVMFDLVDASSFLWRLGLAGIDVGERWQELADVWARIGEEGFYSFNDAHALMAYAGAGRRSEILRVIAGLERTARESTSNGMMAREVGLPLCRGLAAFTDGDFATTITELFDLRIVAARFGGSNAQRDLIEWTLLEAARRSGDTSLERSLAEARLARKPASALARRAHARALEAQRPVHPLPTARYGAQALGPSVISA